MDYVAAQVVPLLDVGYGGAVAFCNLAKVVAALHRVVHPLGRGRARAAAAAAVSAAVVAGRGAGACGVACLTVDVAVSRLLRNPDIKR